MLKYRERLFGGPLHATPLLDAKLTCDPFVPPEARARWRRMADRHVASKDREFGVRAAERVVDAISNDARVDPRIRLAVELAEECRTGQVLRCTRRMLLLPESAPNDYESAPLGSLGQIEMAGAGKKHGEVVVLTPEHRRAVDDALVGYLANYEATWRAGQVEDYYLFLAPRCACSIGAGAANRYCSRAYGCEKAGARINAVAATHSGAPSSDRYASLGASARGRRSTPRARGRPKQPPVSPDPWA